MDQKVQRKVIVTESGQQIAIESAINVTAGVTIPGDALKEEIELDVTDKEFSTMQKQAVKNQIPRGMLIKKRKTEN